MDSPNMYGTCPAGILSPLSEAILFNSVYSNRTRLAIIRCSLFSFYVRDQVLVLFYTVPCRNILVFSTPGISYMGAIKYQPFNHQPPAILPVFELPIVYKHRVLPPPPPPVAALKAVKYNMSKLTNPSLPHCDWQEI
jgi:hypothetical protein